MPTENEQKFVLKLGCEEEIKEASKSSFLCKQAYLVYSKGITLRLREMILQSDDPRPRHRKLKLCFKQKVKGRVIEIEKSLDDRDFSDLWETSINRLEKTRYHLDVEGGGSHWNLWEVDFFKGHNQNYFAMAEHEMPEMQRSPNFIPEIIQKHLLYTVDIDDSRFSSKMLADSQYATKIYQEIVESAK